MGLVLALRPFRLTSLSGLELTTARPWSGNSRYPAKGEGFIFRRAKYRSKGFEIVGVAYDADIEKWKKAIQKDGLSWPQVTDVKQSNGELGSYYDIGSLPNNILLDKEGKIVGVNLSTEEVENLLSKLL